MAARQSRPFTSSCILLHAFWVWQTQLCGTTICRATNICINFKSKFHSFLEDNLFCLWHGQKKIFWKHFTPETIMSCPPVAALRSENKFFDSEKNHSPHPLLQGKWVVVPNKIQTRLFLWKLTLYVERIYFLKIVMFWISYSVSGYLFG